MRQIGMIPGGVDPARFCDYLFAQGVSSKATGGSNGWTVWVLDEDKLPQARAALDHFLADPADPRYDDAKAVAEANRKERERLDRAYRKNVREVRGQWEGVRFRRRPLTVSLIAVCVALFLAEGLSPAFDAWSWQNLGFMDPADHGPVTGPDQGLHAILRGEVWRLVTPALLHAGLLHLVFNVWSLSVLGTLVETRKGTAFLAALVFTSAVVSDVVQYLYMLQFDRALNPFVGISGVVYALLGYVWMKGQNEPEEGMILHPSSVRFMLFWLVLGFLGMMRMANGAHVGGLIIGVLGGLARL